MTPSASINAPLIMELTSLSPNDIDAESRDEINIFGIEDSISTSYSLSRLSTDSTAHLKARSYFSQFNEVELTSSKEKVIKRSLQVYLD